MPITQLIVMPIEGMFGAVSFAQAKTLTRPLPAELARWKP
jgi:hypothetical protein